MFFVYILFGMAFGFVAAALLLRHRVDAMLDVVLDARALYHVAHDQRRAAPAGTRHYITHAGDPQGLPERDGVEVKTARFPVHGRGRGSSKGFPLYRVLPETADDCNEGREALLWCDNRAVITLLLEDNWGTYIATLEGDDQLRVCVSDSLTVRSLSVEAVLTVCIAVRAADADVADVDVGAPARAERGRAATGGRRLSRRKHRPASPPPTTADVTDTETDAEYGCG